MKKVTFCLTSCNRFDLLERTLDSFFANNLYPIDKFILTEDSTSLDMKNKILSKYGNRIELIFNEINQGLCKSIDNMYAKVESDYIFHCEDDWEFKNGNMNFIQNSIDVLEENPDINQVWVRTDLDPTWTESDMNKTSTNVLFKLMKQDHCGDWCGFSFNPGLRRKSDYTRLFPNGYADLILPNKPIVFTEHNCMLHAKKQGYKAATLIKTVCYHTGHGRTTLK